MREFLLGRLAEADEEQFELRLLSDPAFGEEFDTVVDEITDDYLKNQLSDDERERVEKYFLSTTERQNKLEFAAELLRRAESERGKKVTEPRPSVLEQISVFMRQRWFAPIATLAVVVIVAGLAFFQMKSARPENYQSLNLTISETERAEGAAPPERVKLSPNTGLKIALTIPESARGARDYKATLVGRTDLEIDNRTEQAVTVKVPATLLKPGLHAIQLSKVNPDNSPERITGSYYFIVE